IEANLKDKKATSDWIMIRSYVNQSLKSVKYLLPQKPIYKITQLINRTKQQMAMNPQLTNLNIVVAQLNAELQDELKLLTKK
ncbi:2765_t:CDS:1, partial [Gigaspora margarita]